MPVAAIARCSEFMDYVKEISVVLDPITKQEIHTLQDCFGQKHIVQIPLLSDEKYDEHLKAEMQAMNDRAEKFIAVARARGHKIEKMQNWGHDVTECKNCQ